MNDNGTGCDDATAHLPVLGKDAEVSARGAAPINPIDARSELRKVEDLIDVLNDVVADLAGRPSADADADANTEAVVWIRRALEDVLATCTGLLITSQQDVPTRDLRRIP
ncbi:hypothetical protein [Arthrobacter agilis]|uniref:hypothetical protein n=1 Tax=Arthrobacter agilis TaxID=37921 RepID=UPI0027844D24|nr:hypothetical protein [Arthrobacter agilis]MDQ0734763.1 hypothetical protein [Arthrobacter agilis]